MQEALFTQAKINMERSNNQPNSNYELNYAEALMREQACRFAQIEQSVNQRAAMLATQFLRQAKVDSPKTTLTFDQCFLAYKFTLTQADVILAGMHSLAQSQSVSALTAFYRKLALQLHPDKNCHPIAKEAFQAVTEAFERAKSTTHEESSRPNQCYEEQRSSYEFKIY